MTKYNIHTLNNGLRVIHLPSASHVIFCGIGVKVGSRQEERGEEGVAHFCEHVTFKGTNKRSALQILNCLESVGGELNAFTNKEDTIFYAAILKEHLPRAVDLLTDIVFNSVYPEQEMAHEIDVICDEIESYNDSPAELIYDEFENLLFKGHPLGHNILGTREQVKTFTSAHALDFTNRYYIPNNAIFFAYGDIDFKKLVKLLENKEMVRSARNYTHSVSVPVTSDPIHSETHHQAHVMLGSQTFAFDDIRRMPFYLLNNILGGPGMNARLNLLLREKNGLVYTVESTLASYSDTGAWSVYFGCDHHDVKRCLRLVHQELDRMMQHPLSEKQINAAKRQLKGQIAIACDNREQFALDFAKSFLHYNKERDIDTLFQQIDAIKSEQLLQVAQTYFAPNQLQLLLL